jgi:hypothetical protein
MPLISGPTQLLPFSQHFDYGYTAYRHPEFIDVFRSSMVQLELAKGDAVFFNPALFHAAGDNDSTDFDRWANLLQVSACWGKPMESVDATAVLRAVWPHVQNLARKAGHDASGVQALLKAICDGYSFPTNLDKDPPPPDGVRAEPMPQQDFGDDADDVMYTALPSNTAGSRFQSFGVGPDNITARGGLGTVRADETSLMVKGVAVALYPSRKPWHECIQSSRLPCFHTVRLRDNDTVSEA